jgi:ribonuclease D
MDSSVFGAPGARRGRGKQGIIPDRPSSLPYAVPHRPKIVPVAHSHTLIVNDVALADCCQELARAPWLSVDTEFMRERTYYPELCLVQLGTPDAIYCVDMLAVEDTTPVRELLGVADNIKVFHAARQDLETLWPACGGPASPLFDTQIAAALCGHDEQIGYGSLVQTLLDVDLPKEQQRTDWARRPLDDAQLEYAANDVRYLCQVYPRLVDSLESLGRLAWAQEDSARLLDPSLYHIEPEKAYLRVKQGHTLVPAQQQVLRELATWREETAQNSNRPRGWIARDPVLLYLAQTCPRSAAALERVRGLDEGIRKRHGEAIVQAIARGLGHEPRRLFVRTEPLDTAQTQRRERMQALVQERASELGIHPPVIATRRDLDTLVRGGEQTPVLTGWRRQVVGEALLEID